MQRSAITVHPATERFYSEFGGVRSWHCYSAGAHYDPDRMSFGVLVGLDEHAVAPGAGFDWHAHRGVTIVSYVVEGTLRHEGGGEQSVAAGEVFVQHAGSGIRHRETNPSDTDPLRLVQLTVLGDAEPRVTRGGRLRGTGVALVLDGPDAGRWTEADGAATVEEFGDEVLVVRLPS